MRAPAPARLAKRRACGREASWESGVSTAAHWGVYTGETFGRRGPGHAADRRRSGAVGHFRRSRRSAGDARPHFRPARPRGLSRSRSREPRGAGPGGLRFRLVGPGARSRGRGPPGDAGPAGRRRRVRRLLRLGLGGALPPRPEPAQALSESHRRLRLAGQHLFLGRGRGGGRPLPGLLLDDQRRPRLADYPPAHRTAALFRRAAVQERGHRCGLHRPACGRRGPGLLPRRRRGGRVGLAAAPPPWRPPRNRLARAPAQHRCGADAGAGPLADRERAHRPRFPGPLLRRRRPADRLHRRPQRRNAEDSGLGRRRHRAGGGRRSPRWPAAWARSAR